MHWSELAGSNFHLYCYSWNRSNGFCDIDSTSFIFYIHVALLVILMLICLCVIIIFCILTYCHMKKNILEDNIDMKRAVARNLVYLLIASILYFIYNIIPSMFTVIRAALADKPVHSRISLNLGSIATPIVTLKPLRTAIKAISSKCVCCFKGSN